MRKPVTVLDILAKKGKEPVVMVTSYDATMARIVDEADVDIILVGDSAGMVMAGLENTLGVSMDMMVYHTLCVTRVKPKALVVADMPFLSYQAGVHDAVVNAGRLIQEGCAQAVKVEGGMRVIDQVRAIVKADIPVMGHLGLTPQSVHAFGGYKVQGRSEAAAQRLKEDALALEDAGVFSIVLECVPTSLAEEVTRSLVVPTIGIGAGPACDGQVLVIQDLLGMSKEFKPKFVKRYAELFDSIKDAVTTYAREVRSRAFPSEEHCFKG
ncbi:MAG TPA: 3-methyl-2-oxobutanoate hydroxymethyltransferase [Deltaproteobacteria bacterium]|nr:3-methyl-2-oxobutanoate hydroxymethyltransferase [Deltaproteobacteria bacterium]HOM28504.1 3-methyl-2-oxobutanoate hydroxymethyltransferase [Deltaproteobacteria bacterium]HPP80974.1 3-methyl-2-oxobutanoate hydroxymethyltransferase [Deltaproteobacteria bacterium]